MPFPLTANRVRETTATTGSGSFTLAGAVAGYQAFSVIGSGASCIYSAAAGSEFEVGVGTWASGLLTRDEILDSSQGGSKVNFSAGTKSVILAQAAQSVWNGFEEPGGRLTLTENTPVTTSDVTAATTLYYSPFLHGGIKLWTGSYWRWFSIGSGLSTSLSSISIGRLYDVFAYPSGSSAALELVAWNDVTTGTVTGASNTTSIDITSNSHGLAVGDVVHVSGVLGNTAANGTWKVGGVSTNLFTLHTLASGTSSGNGTYTSGGTWRKLRQTMTRSSAISRTDGAWTLGTDKTRLLLGTIRASASGQCEMSATKAFVCNVFNPVLFPMSKATTSTWTSSNGTRPMKSDWAMCLEYVDSLGVNEVEAYSSISGAGNTGLAVAACVGVNSHSTNSAQIYNGGTNGVAYGAGDATYVGFPGAGYNYLMALEMSNATLGTISYGNGIVARVQL